MSRNTYNVFWQNHKMGFDFAKILLIKVFFRIYLL